MTEINLPENFYEAIRIAVEDMKKCEANPVYKIDMDDWHEPINGTCHVCMAGAVMAQNLKVPNNEYMTPGALSNILNKNISNKLYSFDFLRCGRVAAAYSHYTGKMIPISSQNVKDLSLDYCSYEDDREKFYKWCLAIADIFQEIETTNA